MNEHDSIPDMLLRIDRLLATLADLIAEERAEKAWRAELDVRLGRIERAHAIPLTYSLREACSRIGFTASWGYIHPELLPVPVSSRPLRYRVSDIEKLAGNGISQMGRKGPRAGRIKQAS